MQKDKIMKCAACNGKMKKKKSQLEMTVKGVLYILKRFPMRYAGIAGKRY